MRPPSGKPAGGGAKPGATRLLPPADEHAARFARQREADRTATAEDYVELIADLLREEGEARAVDVARRMGVSQATVTATIGRLQRDGLVETKPYRGLFLTGTGSAMAAAAKARHELVVRFLIAVGLDPETAEKDAEGLEHHVSDKALAAFGRWLEREG
ncbi:manganese-binding transcriptional regulator MntR [Falsiroseomonas sp. HW251]|uniref:manganese-binding transcriptional regulator MntR n=1 Tax=Falsiroseomonas sp. HW251 TaxID=3390998 RepID=UPI003D3173FB